LECPGFFEKCGFIAVKNRHQIIINEQSFTDRSHARFRTPIPNLK